MAIQDAQKPIIKTSISKSLTTHLPEVRDDNAWGAQIRSHYGPEDNDDKLPTNIEALEVERQKRKQNYAQIAHDYYELVTLTLEVAWNKKFHFAPFLDDKQSLREALAAHDHYQFMTMGVKPGMRGLDAGCGVGEPAREFARWAGVHITGITITDYQVYRANLHAEKEGISDKVEFVRADFCRMPFPDNTFDFAYAQEATVYAAELRDVYTEMCRVLKPGGVISINEWCMTDKFDPKNPQHLDIRRRLERGNGIVNMKTVKEAIADFEFAGLDVLHMEDHALKGLQSRPWWIPLDGDTSTFSEWGEWMMVFCLKPAVWRTLKAWVWFKIKVGLYNKIDGDSTMESLNTQAQAVFGLRDAGKDGLFTPMFQMYGRKPENWVHPQPEKAREAAEKVAAAEKDIAASKTKST